MSMDAEILTLQVDINDDPMNQKVDAIESRLTGLKKDAQQAIDGVTPTTESLPGYNEAFMRKFSDWERSLTDIGRTRSAMEHTLNSYDREDLSAAYKRKVEIANNSIKDLANSQNLVQELLNSLGPGMSQVFSEGLKGIVGQLSSGIRTTAHSIASTVSRKLTDDEIVDKYMHGPEYNEIRQKLAKQNPNVFTDQNMRKFIMANVPMNVPQYMREAITGGSQVTFRDKPSSYREMLPQTFRQIEPDIKKDKSIRQLGQTAHSNEILTADEIASLGRIVRNNRYAADAAVKAGIISKSGKDLYFNHGTTHDMMDAMAGYLMDDMTVAARGERKYGITDVLNPRSWHNISKKIGNNKVLDGTLEAVRAMDDNFGSWLSPGRFNTKFDRFDETKGNAEFIGRIEHSPRKTSRAFAEYTLDMMEEGAQISGMYPIFRDNATKTWREDRHAKGPRSATRNRTGISPDDYHTISMNDSLLQRIVMSTPSASQAGHNEFSDNMFYLKIAEELADPTLTNEEREKYRQRYAKQLGNGYTVNGTPYISTRIGKTHAEFMKASIVDDIGRRALGKPYAVHDKRTISPEEAAEIRAAGLSVLSNGGVPFDEKTGKSKSHFETFKSFAKTMYNENNLATEGESLETWLGTKFGFTGNKETEKLLSKRGLTEEQRERILEQYGTPNMKVIVGRFGESDMDGANWISDEISKKGFQGRTIGGKATYVPINMSDFRVKNYKQIEGNEKTEALIAPLREEQEKRLQTLSENRQKELEQINKGQANEEWRKKRTAEIESTYNNAKSNIEASYRAQKAAIMNEHGGDLIIPGAGINGEDLRMSKDVQVVEDVNNIKYYNTVLKDKVERGEITQDQLNEMRSRDYSRGTIFAKATYDDANTSSRWLSKQVINSSMNAAFRDPRVQNYFDKVFFNELARMGDDQYVRDTLFQGDQTVDLQSESAQKTINDYMSGVMFRYSEGDRLLPTGVFKYAMAAPNPQNVINNRLKEAGVALTPEQEALQLQNNQVISMESLNKQLGIIRFPATKSGNVTVDNMSAIAAEKLVENGEISRDKMERLARSSGIVDTKGLYFAPNSPILKLLQGEDFDGDLNGYFGLSDNMNPQDAKEFSEVMRIISQYSDAEVEQLWKAKPGTPEFEEAVKRQDLREKGRTAHSDPKEGGYDRNNADDRSAYLVNVLRQHPMMGGAERSADMAALYYHGLNNPKMVKDFAQAILDYESMYNVVSTNMKTDDTWVKTPEQMAAENHSLSFSRMFKYANEAMQTIGENGESERVWNGTSDEYMAGKRIDELGLPSIAQHGLMGTLSARMKARQQGIDPDSGVFTWGDVLKDLPMPKNTSPTSERGKFINMMRGVRQDFLDSKYLIAGNETVQALQAQRALAAQEIQNMIDPTDPHAIETRDKLFKEIGITAFDDFVRIGATEENMGKTPWVRAHVEEQAKQMGKDAKSLVGNASFVPAQTQYQQSSEQPVQQTAQTSAQQQTVQAEQVPSEQIVNPANNKKRTVIQTSNIVPQETTGSWQKAAEEKLKEETADQEARRLMLEAGVQTQVINKALAGSERNTLISAISENNIKDLLSISGVGPTSAPKIMSALQGSKILGIKATSPEEMNQPVVSVNVPTEETKPVESKEPEQKQETGQKAVQASETVAQIGQQKPQQNTEPSNIITLKDLTEQYAKVSGKFNGLGDSNNSVAGLSGLISSAEKERDYYSEIPLVLTQEEEQSLASAESQLAELTKYRDMLKAYQKQNGLKPTDNPFAGPQQAQPAQKATAQAQNNNQPQTQQPQQNGQVNQPAPSNQQPVPPSQPSVPSTSQNQPLVPPGGSFTPGGSQTQPAIDPWMQQAALSYYNELWGKAQSFSGRLYGDALKNEELNKGTPRSIIQANTNDSIATTYENKIKQFQESQEYAALTDVQKSNLDILVSPHTGLVAKSGRDFNYSAQYSSGQLVESMAQAEAKATGAYDSQVEALQKWDDKIKEVTESQERLLNMSKDPKYSKANQNEFKQGADKLAEDLVKLNASRENILQADRKTNQEAFNKQLEGLENRLKPGNRYEKQSKQYQDQISSIRENVQKKYDKGMLSQAAYNEDIKRLDDLENKTSTTALMMRDAFNGVGKSVSQSIRNIAMRFGRQLFQKALNEAKKFVQEFDKSMTSIQMITLKSDEQMSTLGDGLIAKAKELKVSIADITKSAETLYRQGLSDEEVNERLDVISKFSTVSGTKVDAATKLITIAMNTGLVSDPQAAADIVTALGDNAATNASEIEKGIEKAGAAAAADGTTFAELTAMLTAITSSTQIGGNVAGRTLNTIFGRMNKIGTSELIYDENGNAISGSAVAKLLEAQGIKMYDENGNKRSSYSTLYELSQIWEDMSDAEQQQIANAIAGTRQYSNFAAIMQGMSEGKVDDYMGTIAGSEGIVDKKYEVYTKSLQASLTDLKNTYDELINDLVDKGALTGVLSTITGMIQGVDNLTTSFGGLAGILATVVPLMLGLTAMKVGLSTGNIGALAIGAGLAAAGGLIASSANQETAQQRNLAYDEAYNNRLSSYENLDRLKELRKDTDRTDAENQEYATLINTYAKQFGLANDAAGSATYGIDNLTKSLKGLSSGADEAADNVINLADENKQREFAARITNTRGDTITELQEESASNELDLNKEVGLGNTWMLNRLWTYDSENGYQLKDNALKAQQQLVDVGKGNDNLLGLQGTFGRLLTGKKQISYNADLKEPLVSLYYNAAQAHKMGEEELKTTREEWSRRIRDGEITQEQLEAAFNNMDRSAPVNSNSYEGRLAISKDILTRNLEGYYDADQIDYLAKKMAKDWNTNGNASDAYNNIIGTGNTFDEIKRSIDNALKGYVSPTSSNSVKNEYGLESAGIDGYYINEKTGEIYSQAEAEADVQRYNKALNNQVRGYKVVGKDKEAGMIFANYNSANVTTEDSQKLANEDKTFKYYTNAAGERVYTNSEGELLRTDEQLNSAVKAYKENEAMWKGSFRDFNEGHVIEASGATRDEVIRQLNEARELAVQHAFGLRDQNGNLVAERQWSTEEAAQLEADRLNRKEEERFERESLLALKKQQAGTHAWYKNLYGETIERYGADSIGEVERLRQQEIEENPYIIQARDGTILGSYKTREEAAAAQRDNYARYVDAETGENLGVGQEGLTAAKALKPHLYYYANGELLGEDQEGANRAKILSTPKYQFTNSDGKVLSFDTFEDADEANQLAWEQLNSAMQVEYNKLAYNNPLLGSGGFDEQGRDKAIWQSVEEKFKSQLDSLSEGVSSYEAPEITVEEVAHKYHQVFDTSIKSAEEIISGLKQYIPEISDIDPARIVSVYGQLPSEIQAMIDEVIETGEASVEVVEEINNALADIEKPSYKAVYNRFNGSANAGYQAWQDDKNNSTALLADEAIRAIFASGALNEEDPQKAIQQLVSDVNLKDNKQWQSLSEKAPEFARILDQVKLDEHGDVISSPDDILEQITTWLYKNGRDYGERQTTLAERATRAQAAFTGMTEGDWFVSQEAANAAMSEEYEKNIVEPYDAELNKVLSTAKNAPESIQQAIRQGYTSANPIKTFDEYLADNNIGYMSDLDNSYLTEILGAELAQKVKTKTGLSEAETTYAKRLLTNAQYGISGLSAAQRVAGIQELLDSGKVIGEGEGQFSTTVASQYLNGWSGLNDYIALTQAQAAGDTAAFKELGGQEKLDALNLSLEEFQKNAQIEMNIEGVKALEDAGKVAAGTAEELKKLQKGGKVALEVTMQLRSEGYTSGQQRAKLYNGTELEQAEAAMNILQMDRDEYYSRVANGEDLIAEAQNFDRQTNIPYEAETWAALYDNAPPEQRSFIVKAANAAGFKRGMNGAFEHTTGAALSNVNPLAGTSVTYTNDEKSSMLARILAGEERTVGAEGNSELYDAAINSAGEATERYLTKVANGQEVTDQELLDARNEVAVQQLQAAEEAGTITSGVADTYSKLVSETDENVKDVSDSILSQAEQFQKTNTIMNRLSEYSQNEADWSVYSGKYLDELGLSDSEKKYYSDIEHFAELQEKIAKDNKFPDFLEDLVESFDEIGDISDFDSITDLTTKLREIGEQNPAAEVLAEILEKCESIAGLTIEDIGFSSNEGWNTDATLANWSADYLSEEESRKTLNQIAQYASEADSFDTFRNNVFGQDQYNPWTGKTDHVGGIFGNQDEMDRFISAYPDLGEILARAQNEEGYDWKNALTQLTSAGSMYMDTDFDTQYARFSELDKTQEAFARQALETPDFAEWIGQFESMKDVLADWTAGRDASDSLKRLNAEVTATKASRMKHYGDNTDDVNESLKKLSKGGKTASQELTALNKKAFDLQDVRTAWDEAQGKSGLQISKNARKAIADYKGTTEADVKSWSKEEMARQFANNSELANIDNDMNAVVTTLLNDALADIQAAADNGELSFNGKTIDFGGAIDFIFNPETGELNLDNLYQLAYAAQSDAVGVLEDLATGKIAEWTATLHQMTTGDGVSAWIEAQTKSNVGRTSTGGRKYNNRSGSSGGGSGKSDTDKTIEKVENRETKAKHKVTMAQLVQEHYGFTNEYQKQIDAIYDEVSAQKGLLDVYEDNLSLLEAQQDAVTTYSDDWWKLEKQILSTQESIQETKNTIESLDSKVIEVVTAKQENEDRPYTHTRNMINSYVDRYQTIYESGGTMSEAAAYNKWVTNKNLQTDSIRQQINQNKEQIAEWQDLLSKIDENNDNYEAVKDNIWALQEENAELENELLSQEIELNEARLSRIAQVLQNTNSTYEHEINMSDTQGQIYQINRDYSGYRQELANQRANYKNQVKPYQDAITSIREQMATLTPYSAAWYSARDSLYEYEEALEQLSLSIEETDQALRESYLNELFENIDKVNTAAEYRMTGLQERTRNSKLAGDNKNYVKNLDKERLEIVKEITEQQNALDDLINLKNSGKIKKGTAEWDELLNKIKEVQNNMAKLENDAAEKYQETAAASLEAIVTKYDERTRDTDHAMDILKAQESEYRSSGEYTNLKTNLNAQYDLEKQRNKELKAERKELVRELSQYGEGSFEYNNVLKQIQSVDKELATSNNTLKSLKKSADEVDKQMLKATASYENYVHNMYKSIVQQQKDQLNATVSMQNTVLEAIKKSYQEQWNLIKKDIDKKKQALQEEKNIIQERLNARKQAEQQTDKEEQLAELQKQLMIIEADPTRTKEAKELRKQIDDLQKELSGNLADNLASAENKRIDDAIKGMSQYQSNTEEDMNDYLKDANNFKTVFDNLFSGSEEAFYEFMEEINASDMKNKTAEQIEQLKNGWHDQWLKMNGEVETYWEEVASSIKITEDNRKQVRKQLLKLLKQTNAYKSAGEAGRQQQIAEIDDYIESAINAKKVSAEAGDPTIAILGDTNAKIEELKSNTYKTLLDESAQAKLSAIANAVTGSKKYIGGGLVNYTGIARVDGTPSRPEAFLDAEDTANIRAMLDQFSYVKTMPFMSHIDGGMFGGTNNSIGDVNITINQAELSSDQDIEALAGKVGQAFTRELSKRGFNTASYAF